MESVRHGGYRLCSLLVRACPPAVLDASGTIEFEHCGGMSHAAVHVTLQRPQEVRAPLMCIAGHRGDLDFIRLLVEAGARDDAVVAVGEWEGAVSCHGFTPLQWLLLLCEVGNAPARARTAGSTACLGVTSRVSDRRALGCHGGPC